MGGHRRRLGGCRRGVRAPAGRGRCQPRPDRPQAGTAPGHRPAVPRDRGRRAHRRDGPPRPHGGGADHRRHRGSRCGIADLQRRRQHVQRAVSRRPARRLPKSARPQRHPDDGAGPALRASHGGAAARRCPHRGFSVGLHGRRPAFGVRRGQGVLADLRREPVARTARAQRRRGRTGARCHQDPGDGAGGPQLRCARHDRQRPRRCRRRRPGQPGQRAGPHRGAATRRSPRPTTPPTGRRWCCRRTSGCGG